MGSLEGRADTPPRLNWVEPLFLLYPPEADPETIELVLKRRSEIQTIIIHQGFGKQYANAVAYCL